MAFKQRREKVVGSITMAQLYNLFSEHVRLSDNSEKITESWIETASYVYDRLFTHEPARASVLRCESKYGLVGPFDSIYKLHAIASKTKLPPVMTWVVQWIEEFWNTKVTVGDMSYRSLTGKGQGGRGFVDLLIMKLEIKNFIVGNFCTKHKIHPQACAALQDLTSSVASYMEMFGSAGAESSTYMTWISLLPESGQKLIKFTEAGA
jgi:hypothetical protein